MMRYLCILIFSLNLNANFLDAKWEVIKFVGESYFLDTQDITKKYQSFYKGEASGTFYSCNYGGQVSTYTKYDVEEFFKNQEMKIFKKYSKQLGFASEDVYVHKVSCSNNNQVIYPFVTQENSKRAFYPFEGGIYVLEYDKSHYEILQSYRSE